jgi:hypothetical protein
MRHLSGPAGVPGSPLPACPGAIEVRLWEEEIAESESLLHESVRLRDFALAALAEAFLDKCRSSRAEAATCLKDQDYARAGILQQRRWQTLLTEKVALLRDYQKAARMQNLCRRPEETRAKTPAATVHAEASATRASGGLSAPASSGALALAEIPVAALPTGRQISVPGETLSRAIAPRDNRTGPPVMDTHALESHTGQDALDQEGAVPPESEDDFPPFDEVSKQVTLLTDKVALLRDYKKAARMQNLCRRLGELQGDIDVLVELQKTTTGRLLELLRSQAKALRSERNQVYAEVLGFPKDGVSASSTDRLPGPASGPRACSAVMTPASSGARAPSDHPVGGPGNPFPAAGSSRALEPAFIRCPGQSSSTTGRETPDPVPGVHGTDGTSWQPLGQPVRSESPHLDHRPRTRPWYFDNAVPGRKQARQAMAEIMNAYHGSGSNLPRAAVNITDGRGFNWKAWFKNLIIGRELAFPDIQAVCIIRQAGVQHVEIAICRADGSYTTLDPRHPNKTPSVALRSADSERNWRLDTILQTAPHCDKHWTEIVAEQRG